METSEDEIETEPRLPYAYKLIRKIGEGTYGAVYLSEFNSQKYALKKILNTNAEDGLPVMLVREIKILKMVEHPNIIKLVDIAVVDNDHGVLPGKAVFLVFDYVENDLLRLTMSKKYEEHEIRKVIGQILTGVRFLHSRNIMHRDIKTSNILIDCDLNVKIADFGLSKHMNDSDAVYFSDENNADDNPVENNLTANVVTLWYRAPEILLGESYSYKIDIWSIGCILMEMVLNANVMKGRNVDDQLKRIKRVLARLGGYFAGRSRKLYELGGGLLGYFEEERFSAEEALKCEFFNEQEAKGRKRFTDREQTKK
ncbi:CMGC/CDK/CRK7 protein kinase [Vavraia culicis subsp. floridensis]|uniref:CMGC/CDK/CRK7 protein kinase n=1 Tax=Vavraia culicis (isolate floridensis) TaxID=948595 RepID=L2GXB9_VAVCU|nr:CMGC/CDK/CRK7 protein kinase [Vavraia culicis subsp. floridensis]ELA48326.1 CMGC/CDK/CRK7 protein kinase [Vavraia culicis subsp. floridensis]